VLIDVSFLNDLIKVQVIGFGVIG